MRRTAHGKASSELRVECGVNWLTLSLSSTRVEETVQAALNLPEEAVDRDGLCMTHAGHSSQAVISLATSGTVC
jgi:hypothetical protein